MKNRAKHIAIGLIIGLLAGLFIFDMWLCTDEVIEVRYDSIIYEFDTIPIPVPYKVTSYVHTVTHDTIYVHDSIMLTPSIDTALILSDWIKTRLYKDTISNEDLNIYLNEEVTQNRITNREVSYQILRPQLIQNNPALYLGGYIYNGGVSINASYFRKNWYASAGYDPFNKAVFIGGGYKIK